MAFNDRFTGTQTLKVNGTSAKVGTPVVSVLELDSAGNVLRASGATVPTDGDAGYAKGCLFIDTDAALGSIMYLNEGSATSADFNVMESGASSITGVTAGDGLTGGGSSGTVTLNVVAGNGLTAVADSIALAALPSAQILVGNGSNVATAVAVSGDATLSNAGVVAVTDLSLASEARGDIARRGASAWERLSAKTSGQILVGDGTDVVSVAVSGDATLSAAGVLTVTNVNATASVSLTEANILAMNGAPVELIAAPAAGSYIELISCEIIYDFDTAAYTGGGNVVLQYGDTTAATGTVSAANSFGAAGDKVIRLLPTAVADIPRASALNISNDTGAFTDPGTAAGVARVKLGYRVIASGL